METDGSAGPRLRGLRRWNHLAGDQGAQGAGGAEQRCAEAEDAWRVHDDRRRLRGDKA